MYVTPGCWLVNLYDHGRTVLTRVLDCAVTHRVFRLYVPGLYTRRASHDIAELFVKALGLFQGASTTYATAKLDTEARACVVRVGRLDDEMVTIGAGFFVGIGIKNWWESF